MAEGKALGLVAAGSTNIDGYIGFNSQPGIFDYNNTDGVSAGTYDFFGAVAHEIVRSHGDEISATACTIFSTTPLLAFWPQEQPLDISR